jgi:hypothetical protein
VLVKEQAEIDEKRRREGKQPQQDEFIDKLESALMSGNYTGEIKNLWLTKPEKALHADRIPEHVIILAIRRMHGIKAAVARCLGVDRTQVEQWAIDRPAIAEALATEKESIIDLAEARLFESVSSGSPWAIDMTLRTLGKDRGYSTEFRPKSNKGSILEAIDNATEGETKEC